MIYSAGASFNGVYFIQRGIAKMETPLDGESVLTAIALRGDALGIDSFHSSVYSSSAICVTDVSAVWVPAECFNHLLRTCAEFRLRIEEAVGKALAESAVMIKLMATREAEAKVAFLLIKVFQSGGTNVGNRKSFNVALSRSEMAEYLGLRIETVSRKLSDLSDRGLIRVNGRRIHMRDFDALQKLCKPFASITT
jgi:CRP/FNR family transcriptional regulator